MRNDIAKLICERQRRGSRNKSLKTALRLDPRFDYDSGDYDWGPTYKSSARRRQGTGSSEHKSLNENLRPLYQFLEKSVGRPWNDVYSEICAQIDPRRAIGHHVLQHVGWHVQLHPIIIDGVPYHVGWRASLYELTGLYVDEDGILAKRVRQARVKTPAPITRIHWYGNVYYELLEFSNFAVCGCRTFKEKINENLVVYDRRHKWHGKPVPSSLICPHGNSPLVRNIWYVVEYAYHQPDDVFKEYRHSQDSPVEKIYYRDRPELMATPYEKSRHTANKKQLKAIKQYLAEEAAKAAS